MSHHQIKAILFDLGDTILNFGNVPKVRVFLEGARLTYDYLTKQDQSVGPFGWYATKYLVHLRVRNLWANLTGNDFDAMSLLKKIGRGDEITLTQEQWEELVWLWYEPLSKLAVVEPDIKETFEKFKQMELKLGIVSNTFVNRNALEKQLAELELLDCFDMRMYSYEYAFRKPNPGIFKIAAEQIGETFENIAFVGDRIDKDIQPALDQGMVAVLKDAYTNTGKKTPPGAWRVKNLSELPSLIEKHNTESNAWVKGPTLQTPSKRLH